MINGKKALRIIYCLALIAAMFPGALLSPSHTFAAVNYIMQQPVSVSASSEADPSLSASKAIDNDANTVWSSATGDPSGAATQWLAINLGGSRSIRKATLIPRAGGAGFPVDFKFQTSTDGTNWTDVSGQSYTGYANPGASEQTFTFSADVTAQYLRLYVTREGLDGGGHYYAQIAEFRAYSAEATVPVYTKEKPVSAAASSEAVPSLSASRAIDNDAGTIWSSAISDPSGTVPQWLSLDLGSGKRIRRVALLPRSGGGGFPVDFNFQYSTDGTNWANVVGSSYTGYANPGSAQQVFTFDADVTARYFRLNVTKEGTDDGGHYYAQIAEFNVYSADTRAYLQETPIGAAASSIVDANWAAAYAIDDNPDSIWSSALSNPSGTVNQWLSVDLGANSYIGRVRLLPRANGYGFPVDFKLQSSTNGTSWIDVNGQAYTAYPNPGSAEQSFRFSSPVFARYIRLYVTKEGTDDGGSYYAQLAALKVDSVATGSMTPGPSPAIVGTSYPTEDIVVSDYVVTGAPYNADSTGASDATAAIQQAINDCYDNGGGTVWLPAGTYKVTNTLVVKPYVTLRGDRRDPDAGSGSYGTVISAQVASGAAGPVLFEVRGSAAVDGMTVYYPSQNAASPVAYNYTFRIKGGEETTDWADYLIQNVTMLNSYKGIGISAEAYQGNEHQTAILQNIKGTVLYRGLVAFNSSNVDMMRSIDFNNRYWENAGAGYHAPSAGTLAAWTRSNGIAFQFGGLEWDQFYKISCKDYKVGIQFDSAPRIETAAVFQYVAVQNTDIAVKVNALDSRWGVGFLRSELSGSVYSIQNASAGYVKATDSTLSGATSGTVNIYTPGTSPTSYPEQSMPKVSRAVLYDAVAQYNAPYTLPYAGTPTLDATTAIQNAINAASSAGGGVVYLRAGLYKISTHLTVPANVELRGSSPAARDNPNSSFGTVLIVYEGKNTANPATDTAAVTLSGNGAGIRNVRLFYPESNPADGVKPYPYSIRLNGTGDYAENIGFIASYNGIDAATNATDGHMIRNIQGSVLNKAIAVRSGSGGQGWVETVSIDHAMSARNFLISLYGWTGDAGGAILTNSRANLTLVEVSGTSTSRENILNLFAYGPSKDVVVKSGKAAIYNVGGDNIGNYIVQADAGASADVMNLMRYNGATSTGTVTVYNEIHL